MKKRWFKLVAILIFTTFASALWISGTASAQAVTATATPPAAGTATTAPPTATGEAPVTCADAENALKTFNPDLAEQEYKAILTAQPNARCALAGLQTIAVVRAALAGSQTIAATDAKGDICAVADGYRQNNRLDDAGQTYKAILAVQPGTMCAVGGLQVVAGMKCKLADGRAFWDSAGARSIYESIQKDYPTLPCAVNGLAWLPYLQSLFVAFLILIVIVALIIFLGINQLTNIFDGIIEQITKLLNLHLDIEDFTSGTALSKEEFDPINQSLVAEMERFLKFWRTPTKMGQLELCDGPYKAIDLPAIPAAPADTQAFLKFIQQLIPKNTLTVKGTLEYTQEKGAGLSIKIIGPGDKILDCQTIWRKDIDPAYLPPSNAVKPAADEYFELAEAAASVVMWGVQKYKYGKESDEKLRRTFGTGKRESYIFTRMAACHEDTEQERLLRMALDKDSRNKAALLYLGLNLSSRKYMGNKETWPEFKKKAINFFERAINLSGPREDGKSYKDAPVFIAANYALGASAFEEFCGKDTVPQNYPDKDTPDFNSLMRAKEYLQKALVAATAHVNKNVIEDDVARMIEIPYQDLRRWSKNTPIDDAWFDNRAMIFHLDGRIFYNLACHYSTSVMLGKLKDVSDKVKEDALNKALSCLRDALVREPHYVEYVRDDPTLKTLRDAKQEEIDEIIKQLKTTTSTTPLAALVGQQNAERLLATKISTLDDLRRQTKGDQSCKALADSCKIHIDLLRHWAQAAKLTQINGIDLDYVVLLEASGIASLEQLKDQKGKEKESSLLKTLKATKEKLSLNIELPEENKLSGWIVWADALSQVEPKLDPIASSTFRKKPQVGTKS